MTLQEYVNSIRRYVPTSKNLEAALVFDSINLARLELGRFFDFDISIATFTGDSAAQEFTLAPNVQKVLTCFCLYGNVRYPLARIPMKEYMWEGMVSLPAYYWLNHRIESGAYESYIGFYPIPMTGCKIEVKCSKKLDALSSPDEDDMIPEIFTDLVIFLAASDLAMKAGNPGLGNLYYNLYIKKRQQIVTSEI